MPPVSVGYLNQGVIMKITVNKRKCLKRKDMNHIN